MRKLYRKIIPVGIILGIIASNIALISNTMDGNLVSESDLGSESKFQEVKHLPTAATVTLTSPSINDTSVEYGSGDSVLFQVTVTSNDPGFQVRDPNASGPRVKHLEWPRRSQRSVASESPVEG